VTQARPDNAYSAPIKWQKDYYPYTSIKPPDCSARATSDQGQRCDIVFLAARDERSGAAPLRVSF
jgi:hypothetical protein